MLFKSICALAFLVATATLVQGYRTLDDLNGRSGPGTNFPVIKSFPRGSDVPVLCQTEGESVNGDNVWSVVQENPRVYVTDWYLDTGGRTWLDGVPRCNNGGGGATGSGPYPVNDDVNGRSGPGTGFSIITTFPKGTMVRVLCQTEGDSINNDNVWSKVQDNPAVYVSDYYVETGGKTWLPDVPRCSGGPTPPTPPPSGDCPQKIINAAKTQFGRPYSWGGGNWYGPTNGILGGGNDDRGVYGFDCSGLTMYAVFQATGKKLGHYTGNQYNDGQGVRIPFDQKQPGDLIFWAESVGDKNNGNASRHVAIYVGGSTTIDAYDHGVPLGFRDLNKNYSVNDRMPYVKRFC